MVKDGLDIAPEAFRSELPGSDGAKLSAEERAFFKAKGFIIKRHLIDPELVKEMRDFAWDHAPEGVRHDDPSTWIDPGKQWTPNERDPNGERARNYYKGKTSWKFHGAGEEHFIRRMVNGGPVRRLVQQFIGNTVKPTEKARGIYTIFPSADPGTLHLHRDTHPFQLGMFVYLTEVPPRGGGYTVLPGSHRAVYHSMQSEFHDEAGPDHEVVMAKLKRNITPLECIGSPGDCIFFHHRIVHTSGIHTTPGHVRMAIPCDFQRNDWLLRPETPTENGGSKRQVMAQGKQGMRLWFIDTKEYMESWPPPVDMWEHWNI